MSKKIGKMIISLMLLMAMVFGISSKALAAGTPRFEEGGGGGFTGEQQRQDYSYPGGQWYAYLLVRANMVNGWYNGMIYSHVGSNLVGFSYDNPTPQTTGNYTRIYTHYVGWGESWDDFCEDTLEVYF